MWPASAYGRAAVAASCAILALVASPPLAARPSKPPPKKRPPRLIITRAHGATIPIPRSFFGLSTEYWALPDYMVRQRTFERTLSLLRVGRDGPTQLRIGGDSADLTYWNPGSYPLPPNAYVLTDAWFRSTASLVRDLRLRVLFDLNLLRSTPDVSAGLARAALSYMPPATVAGFEIGNEPDRYAGYTISDYVRDYQSYVSALAGIPSVPLMGPASGDANLASGYAWVRGLIVGAHPRLGEVTAHRYGLNACLPRGFPRYPTIGKLLSDSVEADVVRPVAAAVQYAHAAHLRFRLDEMNSVTCGGLPGVSNTFATALWAPDALFRMLQTGADGVNVHIRPDTVNGPFVITTNGLNARPLLYGLILFARTLQGNGELVPLRMRPAGGPAGRLDAWAVQAGRHRLRVLLINKTKKPVNTVLRLHGADDASVERLAAYGARVISGVTLDGQHLGPGAGWLGKKVVRRVALKAGQYDLVVPRYSAALVTVPTR